MVRIDLNLSHHTSLRLRLGQVSEFFYKEHVKSKANQEEKCLGFHLLTGALILKNGIAQGIYLWG